jgi:hypothetical protein
MADKRLIGKAREGEVKWVKKDKTNAPEIDPTPRFGNLYPYLLKAGAPLRESLSPLDSDPEIVKRRAIIKQNPHVSAQGLCTLFDNTNAPVLTGWPFRTWTLAYKDKAYRQRIHVLISKDKKKIG